MATDHRRLVVLPPVDAGRAHGRDQHISDTPYASPDVHRGQRSAHHSHPPPITPGASSFSRSNSPSPARTRSHTVALAINPNHSGIIKRKPLSSAASPLATRYSSATHLTILPGSLPLPETRFSRSYSLDSPTLYEYPATVGPSIASVASPTTGPLDKSSPANYRAAEHTAELLSRNNPSNNPAAPQTSPPAVLPEHADLTAHVFPSHTLDVRPESIIEEDTDNDSDSTYSLNTNDNPAMPIIAPKPIPPHLNLGRANNNYSQDSATLIDQSNPPQFNKPLPKSPGSSKLGSFFAWAASPSPSTSEFSSFPSPLSPRPSILTDDSSTTSGVPSSHHNGAKANASTANPLGYCESSLLTPPAATPPPPPQIEEMEDELKGISAELASSIRREMDLEDLVDRLQAQVDNPQAPGKRTSDYFSDSGYSSAKLSEYDQSRDEVEKIQRRADQEKAQVRLELTTKLQDERSRRKLLDQQIKELAERASQIDRAQMSSVDANGRVKELERTCEDLRRRLSEEKQVKDNFEDLLSALKGELRNASNERDNLRDEIVPQLRARVEGLEAEASQHVNLTYESTKMQQEMQTLKQENTNLRNAKDQPASRMSLGLSRSNSVTAGSFKLQKPPAGLARSNTVKQVESRDALSDRLKDVEAQRDALHSALKNLLERQEYQNRENEKKIKSLEIERERLLASSPRKAGFEKDISNLRNEITVLRRRAEEAVEQKWQVEKGLGGLKMDLDRAEEEIASLRSLLTEKDILIPPSFSRSSGNASASAVPVTSASLEAAFKDLQLAYKESLERIKNLELGGAGIGDTDERTQLAIQRLEQSLSAAVSERDAAKQDAAAFKTQLDSLTASESKHLESERALADELRESARRVEELAIQVRQQLAANAGLRQRLSDTVARGDADRKANVERITGLQSRLRTLEEQLLAAQSASEDRLSRHEEQLTALKEAHNTQLRRANTSPALGGLMSPRKSSLSPMASPLFPRSPRLAAQKSIEEEAQIVSLRTKVEELEKSLTEADSQMQDVVARMSAAQIEVFTLQEERETAVRETRRLQKVIEDERVKTFEERFKTLSGSV